MKVKLEELIKVKTGKLDANAANENGQYPFFTCSKEPLSINTYSYDCECVLVAGNGDLNVKYYNGKFDAYQRTYILESNSNKLYMPYLYFFMDKYVDTLRKQSIGGVIKYIKLENITDAKIELLPKDEQVRICKILDRVKLSINSQKNQLQKLDTLIKARFVEMFGDVLLNDKCFDVKRLSKLASLITKGASPNWQGFQYVDDKSQTLFITSENVKNGYLDLSNSRYVSNEYNIKQSRSMLEKGDFLINIVGASIGRAAIYDLDIKANMNQASALVRLKEGLINEMYLNYYLNSEKALTMYNSMKSDTGRANLSLNDIGNLSIIIPPIELQNKFANFVMQVEKIKLDIKKTLDKTKQLFDSLMQGYFGQ